MAWTNADLKIFASGLAIGGEWNGGVGKRVSDFDVSFVEIPVMSEIYLYKGTSESNFDVALFPDQIMDEVEELQE